MQAYPVLRTATALAAFFFIFAVVAGSFTNFGLSAPANLAPAADVAQLEEIDVTRVVTESTESLAADAMDESAEMAEMAEEASAAEVETELFEEASEVVEEEVVEEEAMDEEAAAAPPVPEATLPASATAAPQTTDSIQGDNAEDSATGEEPLLTPTVSTLPRVTPPTPLPDRELGLAEADEAANNASDGDVVADEEESVKETAAPPEPDIVSGRSIASLPWLQIGLGLLLLLLAGFTFYARKQR